MFPKAVWNAHLSLALSIILLAPAAVWAQVDVANETELRAAIFNANTGGDPVINLLNDITLTQSLPMISSNITLDGGNFTIDANNVGRVFFVESGTVSISNVVVANAVAQGGNGGDANSDSGGGGGGLGAGAAVFVNNGATVTVTNVTVASASATGGAGGISSGAGGFGGGGGGGGLGGNGGSGETFASGGGGGYAGAGGNAAPGPGGGNGGGGGEFGSGGVGGTFAGGGGGGQEGNGAAAVSSTGGGGGGVTANAVGSTGGGAEGGDGAISTGNGQNAAANGGGGGGGVDAGGNGLASGGGGGAGLDAPGGFGGVGAGGGGANANGSAGAGGLFGGGGAVALQGGNGGYGGGGGGSSDIFLVLGGSGGFGAGGGGASTGGAGGAFGGAGGSGTAAAGGGGAALGGAVFVATGGTLTINDGSLSANVGTNTVTAGTGATDGEALGTTIFLHGTAAITLNVTGTSTLHDFDAIAGGGDLTKTGAGTLQILGENSNYSGTTTIGDTFGTGGTLEIGAGGSLGAGGVTLYDGTLLANTSLTFGNDITLGPAATINSGAGDLVLNGTIVGGALMKTGAGTLTLSGANSYGGGTAINGGTLHLANGSALGTGNLTILGSDVSYADGVTIATPIELQANAGLIVNTGSAEQSGVISELGGSYGITKTGAGTLTLSGLNTYTGATFVDEGTLRAGAADVFGVNSAMTVCGCFGTLDLNGFNQTLGSLEGDGSVTLGTAALTVGTLGTDTAFGGVISGDGSLTKVGIGTLALWGVNTYSGGTTITAGAIAVGDDDALGTGEVTLNGGTLYVDAFTLSLDNAIVLGAGNGTIDLGFNEIIHNGTISGDGSLSIVGGGFTYAVLFGDNSYTGGTSVDTLSGISLQHQNALGVGALTMFDFSALEFGNGLTITNAINLQGDVFFDVFPDESAIHSGVISGSFGFDFLGGTLTLTGANTYTGATIVSGGILRAGAENVFGVDSATEVCDCGATLDLNGFNQTLGSLQGEGNVTLGTATLTVGTLNTPTTFSGVISGAGSLTKTGTNILTLSGENIYTGATNVDAGTLLAGDVNVFGSNSAVTVAAGALLDLDGFDQTLGSLAGAGDVDLGIAMLTVGTDNSDTPFSGVISGFGGLTKTGTGTLTLTGANTYSGGTIVSGGMLIGTTTSLQGSIDSNAAVTFDQDTDGTFTGLITGSGSLFKTGTGTVAMSGDNFYTGGTTVTGGAIGVGNTFALGAGDVTLDGGALRVDTLSLSLINNITLGAGNGTIDTAGNFLDHFATITGGGSLSVVGGFTALYGDNSYSGGTSVGGLGVISLQHNNALGTGGLTMLDSGVVDFRNGVNVENGITLQADIVMASDGNATYSGVIGESGGSFGFTKGGGGVLMLSRANTYTGATTVGFGTLRAGADNAFGVNSATTVLVGGTLDLNGFNQTLGSLAGVGGNVTLGTAALTVGTNFTSTAFAGVISGDGSLTKTGTGILTLSGANTYAGGTTLAGGLINIVSGDNLGTGAITFAGGGLQFGADLTLAQPLVFNGAALLDTNGFAIGLSNTISGSGGLTKEGLGTLTLFGANTYDGVTSVNMGTLQAGAANVFGTGGIINVGAGGTLDLNGFDYTFGTLVGAGNITLGSAALTVGGHNIDTTYSGVISGLGSFTKTGTGILTLSGSSTYSGGTTLAGGLVNITAGDNLGTGAITFAGGGVQFGAALTLAQPLFFTGAGATFDTNGFNIGLSNTISGSGGMTKTGLGILTLSGASTYTGATTVNAGVLRAGAANVFGGGAATVAAGALLDLNGFNQTLGSLAGAGNVSLGSATLTTGGNNTSTTFSGFMSGSGSLTKTGTGTLTLSGLNSYTGGTTVTGGGAIAVGNSNALGTGAVTLNGGTLLAATSDPSIPLVLANNITLGAGNGTIDTTSRFTSLTGTISGPGSLSLVGGSANLTGNNTYTGGTIVTGTSLALQHNQALGTGGLTMRSNGSLGFAPGVNIANAMTLETNIIMAAPFFGNATFSGAIGESGGSFGITTLGGGGGVLTLSGANTYTGATTVSSATLRAGAANVFGINSATTVSAGALLDLNGFNQALGSLAGAGNVTLGSATLTVGGNNASTTYSGVLSGAGALTKVGAGILTLSGVNTYLGGTTVAGGTLQVGTGAITTASLAGPVTVQGGATLGGTGTITGAVTINNGATLAPGASIGTLTTGTLNLTGGSLLDFEFGAPGVSDRVIVNGNLTLDGTLNVIDAGGFGAGLYRLFDYTGLLTDNGLVIGTTPAGTHASDLQIQTSVPKQVNLLSLSGTTFLFWDGTGNAGNGRIDGGNGTWTATGFGWTNATGEANLPYSANRFTIFQGTGGTVTVNGGAGNVISVGMQFAADGYRLVGDALTLGQPLTTIRVGNGDISGAGMVATINSPLTGGGLFKTDFGTLILGGANTYTGQTIVDAGTLRLGSPTALGLTTDLILGANGLLDLGTFSLAMHQILGTGTVGLGNGRLTLGLSDQTSTFAGRLTGGGVFVKTGTGRLTLTGANTHTGDTRVERGTLTAGVLGAFGLDNAITVNPGGTLDLNHLTQAIGSLAGDGDVGLGSTMLITGTDGTHTWFGGRISGRGGIVKTGTGRWTLAGNNDYTGPTVVAQGILRLGAGGGSLDDSSSITVLPGATLDLNGFSFRAGSIGGGGRIKLGTNGMLTLGAGDVSSLFSGTLFGAGTLRKIGSGTLWLTGAQAHTGGTVVEAGALLGDSTSLSGDIVNDGVVAFDQALDGLYAGTMSGTGSLVTRGAGTITLSGANSYTGGTLVEAGTLVGSSQSLQGLVITNAALRFDQAFDGLFNGVLGGEGTFTKAGTGTLTLEGAHALTGLTTVEAGTLLVNGSIAGNLTVRDGASIGTQDQIGVVGDVTLNPGSSYRAAIGADGSGSMLVSNGTIRMGGARIALETDDTTSQRRIQAPIVYAAGGVLGEAAFTTDRAHLEGYLTGTGQTLFLTVLDNTVPLAASATSRNGAAAAAAIDRLRPFATGDQFTITRELAAMADADLTRAFDVIAGEVHASALQLTAADAEAAADLIRAEMRRRTMPTDGMTLRSAAPGFAPAPATWGGGRRWWGQYGGQRVSFASTPAAFGAAGYVGGFSLGLDWAPARNWILGAGGGYALGELMTDGIDNKVDTTAPRAMGYVGYGRGRWTAHAGTSVARTTYRTRRGIAFEARLDPQFGGQQMFDGVDRLARGEQTGVDTSAWVDLSFDTAIGGWTLQPGAGFRAARYGYDAWSETGAGALSLSAPNQHLRSTQADLNLHISRAAGGLRPYGSVTYRRELGKGLTETRLQFGTDAAGAFRVQGQPFAADRMIGGVGLTSAHAGLSFGYRVDTGGGQLRHAVDFGVRFD